MAIQRITNRIIEVSLIVLLVFTPLARGTVQVWAISIAHFITLVMLTAYLLQITFRAQLRWVKTPLNLPLIALFVLAVISSFSSIEWYASLHALMKLANYIILYFIIVNSIRERAQVRRVAYTIMGVGTFLALFGMVKYLGEVCPPWWDYGTLHRAFSATYGNHNHLAGYLEMAIPITIGLLIAVRKGWVNAILFAVLAELMMAQVKRGENSDHDTT